VSLIVALWCLPSHPVPNHGRRGCCEGGYPGNSLGSLHLLEGAPGLITSSCFARSLPAAANDSYSATFRERLVLSHYFSSQHLVIVETPPDILILAYHGEFFVRHPPRLLPGGVIFSYAPEASQSGIGIVSNSSEDAVASARPCLQQTTN
jgi:hypothetical protein